MSHLNKEEIKKIYQLLTSPNVDGLVQKLEDQSSISQLRGPELEVAKKVAQGTTIENFEAFLLSNEVPPVKLSESEMELIQGGGLKGRFFKWISDLFYQAIKEVGDEIGCVAGVGYV